MQQVYTYKRTLIVLAVVTVLLLSTVQVFAYGHGGGGQNAGSAGAASAGQKGTSASGGSGGNSPSGTWGYNQPSWSAANNVANQVANTLNGMNYSPPGSGPGSWSANPSNWNSSGSYQSNVSWNGSSNGGGSGGFGGGTGGGTTGTVVVPCVGSGNTGSKGGGNGCIGSSAVIQRPATGYFDGVYTDTYGTCLVNGWAYDPDNANTQISVHVYKDGWAGFPGATFVTACTANTPRPDVNQIIGIPGDHGFQCQLPASYIGSGNHTLYIHAIDINGTPNNLLRTNGKQLNCAPATTPGGGGTVTPPPPPPPPPQCNDSFDNDGDTIIDFSGTDPGCTDANDNDETDPPIITANNKGGSVTVRANSPVDIDWNPNGNVSCKLSANLTDNTPSNSDIGTQTVTVQSQTTFTITCAGGSDSVVVKVLAVIQET